MIDKPTRALLDGDILVYRVAWGAQGEPETIAMARMETAISGILDALEISDYAIFLTSSDKSNFRYDLYPEYKANRIQEKPQHYEFLRKLLREDYGAETIDGAEADDALGYNTNKNHTVICSIDKDLDQIPGWHYNWVKGLLYHLTPIESQRNFYKQVLTGDRTDNIKGCPKIGPVFAERYTEGCQDETDLLHVVAELYSQKIKRRDWKDELLLNGNLLWVQRKPGQRWTTSWGEVVSKKLLQEFAPNVVLDSITNPT